MLLKCSRLSLLCVSSKAASRHLHPGSFSEFSSHQVHGLPGTVPGLCQALAMPSSNVRFLELETTDKIINSRESQLFLSEDLLLTAFLLYLSLTEEEDVALVKTAG